jgi:mRNA interferase RelE/StbE
MFKLVFDELAIQFLEKQPKEVRQRIFNKLVQTKENPLRFFERLAGRKDYKLRVGDYRVLADIDSGAQTIYITVVGHRKNIYKK